MTLRKAVEAGRYAIALVLIGCAVGESAEDTTFGSASFDPTQASASTGTASHGGATSLTSDPDDTSPGASDGDGSDDTASPGSTTTTDPGEDAASGTTADLGMQPESGMYSDCLSTAECIGQDACITVLDEQQAPIDGFCSKDDCVDPITDCEPSPGGTATPVCFSLMLMGAPAEVCALDCAGGESCPAGMVCREVTGGSICV